MDELAKLREANERNARVQARYDELMREGKHGHYETMFRVVREEVEKPLATLKEIAECDEPFLASTAYMMRDKARAARS